ncbi:hypothetical protein [Roseovarius atlanticus]|uniref:hypothetical protein n=1 Tax=Roseovarius atlanticus TaxID=1641875 RepID=UPI001C96FC0B|nr:hypothetical protein [Roseovarius atlanticus]MBY5986399.1 hypothetical protein [Roseovarius atlanticus]MBY6125039.1 hypothetical protein [Roseovarius atlanticus]MBY6150500.1 hypothetical protein [Roseovarius atlanticus]
MYAISLTSIPPRLARLGPVLEALLAQRPAPEHVFLSLPERYARFPGPVTLPCLPAGVTLLRGGADLGPAMKALPAARALAGRDMRLIYCDDDWLPALDWAAQLLTDAEDVATTGQAWDIARLGRMGAGADIAQGFAGVCIRPEWLAGPEVDPPPEATLADDIWLSGQLARQGVTIRARPEARRRLRPAFDDAHALQDRTPRDAVNRACAALVHARYGVWPEASSASTARAARS